MALRDHPKRTVFIGVCLTAIAFLSCWVAASVHIGWLSAIIYVAAAVVGFIGGLMALQDSV
jgi:hypothetical protein